MLSHALTLRSSMAVHAQNYCSIIEVHLRRCFWVSAFVSPQPFFSGQAQSALYLEPVTAWAGLSPFMSYWERGIIWEIIPAVSWSEANCSSGNASVTPPAHFQWLTASVPVRSCVTRWKSCGFYNFIPASLFRRFPHLLPRTVSHSHLAEVHCSRIKKSGPVLEWRLGRRDFFTSVV